MEIRRIETGTIPTSITGGTNEKIKPIISNNEEALENLKKQTL